MRKARALKAQRREEYQKAHSSTNRSHEEQSNVANKQLEKKRRLEEEALQKVGRGEENGGKIICMINSIYHYTLRVLIGGIFAVEFHCTHCT